MKRRRKRGNFIPPPPPPSRVRSRVNRRLPRLIICKPISRVYQTDFTGRGETARRGFRGKSTPTLGEGRGGGEGTIESRRGRSLMIRVRFLENNSLASEEQAVGSSSPRLLSPLPSPQPFQFYTSIDTARRSIPVVVRSSLKRKMSGLSLSLRFLA